VGGKSVSSFFGNTSILSHKAGKPISLNGRYIVFLNQEFLVSNQRSADFYLAGIEKSSATTQTVCSSVKIIHTSESFYFCLQPLF